MPPPTAHYSRIVEEMAQKKTKYENIFEEQAAELRKEPQKCQEAYDRISRCDDIFKPGERWYPNDTEKGVYMKRMEDICRINPTSFDDRIRISFAAHGILMYIVLLEMGQLPTKVQHQISKRAADLRRQASPKSLPSNQILDQSLQPIPVLAKLNKPSITAAKHCVTTDELNSFAHDPFQLIGKQFILCSTEVAELADSEGLLYEVVGVGSSKESGKWYQVQLEGCVDSICLQDQEMINMMKQSVLLVV